MPPRSAFDNHRCSLHELHTFPSRRLLGKALEWQERARALTAQRAPLKRLRELLHAGLRLGAALPQVEELRREIRRREWEEAARKARPPLPC